MMALMLSAIGGLVCLALFVRIARPNPSFTGMVAGVLVLVIGLCTTLFDPVTGEGGYLLLDAISVPRITFVGLLLVAVFLMIPRRHNTVHVTSVLLALAGVHLALMLTAQGPLAGALWVLGAAVTWVALPSGPAKRVALPYLAVSGVLGLVGELIGGVAGDLALLLAVAIRMGIFPFHSWVVGAYSMAPVTIAVAIITPMSALGLIGRFPMDVHEGVGLAVAIVLASGALLTAGLALVQRSMRRSVGLLTVSVQGIVLIGVLGSDHIGHLGGLMMWGTTGLSLLGLGLVTAALVSRHGSIQIDRHSGLLGQAPFFAIVFLLFGFASVGAPGTADFASTDLVLHGGMADQPVLLLLFIGAVSTQGYTVLHIFFRVFFGPERGLRLADALPRERVALAGLAGVLILFGLAPQLMFDVWSFARDVLP